MNRLNTITILILTLTIYCTAAPSAADTPQAVPTFHCIGLYWNPQKGSPDNTCRVRYRPAGSETWATALPLWFDSRPRETFEHL